MLILWSKFLDFRDPNFWISWFRNSKILIFFSFQMVTCCMLLEALMMILWSKFMDFLISWMLQNFLAVFLEFWKTRQINREARAIIISSSKTGVTIKAIETWTGRTRTTGCTNVWSGCGWHLRWLGMIGNEGIPCLKGIGRNSLNWGFLPRNL